MRRWFGPAFLAFVLTFTGFVVVGASTANSTFEFTHPRTHPMVADRTRVASLGSDTTTVAATKATEKSPEADAAPVITATTRNLYLKRANTTLTAVLPSGTYRADAPGKVITGTVSGGARTVQVQSRGTNGTWVTLNETTSRPDGTFAIATPTWWVTTAVLRVYAPATANQTAAATENTATVTVRRTYTPRGGTATAYTLRKNARWNPCEPIAYRVNARHAWPGALHDISTTFHAISQATGLRFTYAGTTTYVPLSHHPGHWPGGTDITIGWASPAQVPQLSGSGIGLGGSTVYGNTLRSDGKVALDYTQSLRGRSAAETDRLRRTLLLHELGHVLGLNHVRDKRSIMYPSLLVGPAAYNTGDLHGLAHLGATGGCVR